VGDFDGALAELERRGADIERRFGIPHGPCATLRTPGVDRRAVYELSRPDADRHLRGRIDFAAQSSGLEEGPR
jgi:hypothetical protein